MKLPKKRENINSLLKCSVSTQKNLVRDLHAVYDRYHHDCWLAVAKIQACWFGAIITTISSIIYKSGKSATDSTDGWILL